MTGSIFDFVADELERRTDLAKLEARGTVRLALKTAGLDARTVTVEQIGVMLQRVMPSEMRARGVEGPEQVCEAILTALKAAHPGAAAADSESPEAIFRRLAQT
jgi:hypothetical protein